jgi:hypothetical protein
MLRRRVWPRIAIAITVASCGDAFTTAPDDSGGPTGIDGSMDAGALDGAVEDVGARRDGDIRDAVSEAIAKLDGSRDRVDSGPIDLDSGPIDLDSGPIGADGGLDASSCVRTCPSGFDCLTGKCLDRAATHFSAMTAKSSNWSDGYTASLGSAFVLDTFEWRSGLTIDVWTDVMADSLEPSVLHYSGIVSQTYMGMTLTAGLLGLVPGATSEVSDVRWTAPADGSYSIDATFTGISTPSTMVTAGVFIKNTTGPGSSQSLNKYGGGNSFKYPTATQTLAAGDAVDFYVAPIPNSDEASGGTELVATITAN